MTMHRSKTAHINEDLPIHLFIYILARFITTLDAFGSANTGFMQDIKLCTNTIIVNLASDLYRHIYTTGKLGPDPLERRYGPRIFASVEHAYSVFIPWIWTGGGLGGRDSHTAPPLG